MGRRSRRVLAPISELRTVGRRRTLGADARAGVVLGVESVPDGLASGLLAGVNPVGLWWVVQWLLLGGVVGWRPLVPGAALTGLGQVLVMAVSGLYLPQVIARQAERFGAIGAAFVVVSWLVVLGLLLVVAAVVGAELTRARTPPAPR